MIGFLAIAGLTALVSAPFPLQNPPGGVQSTATAPGMQSQTAGQPGQSQPGSDNTVTAGLNQSFMLANLQYRVLKVTPGLESYSLVHDQRGTRLTPGFKKDRLVVVDVEVTNTSGAPATFTGIQPALVDAGGAMTTQAQWDVRQQSYIRMAGDANGAAMRFDSSTSYDPTSSNSGDGTNPVMVAPGGHVKFTLIFSEPMAARPGSVRFQSTQQQASAGSVGVVSLNAKD